MKMDGNMQMETMEQHLLFHKAMAEDEESFARINGYLDILKDAGSGEKLNDPLDESIRAVFSLVLERGLDPWAIDLEQFARMYSEKVSSNRFDMIVAGRLLLMAWKILNLQSERTRMTAEPPVEVEAVDETDFDFIEEDPMVVPEVSFRRAYVRDEPRPVTMMDLLDAFEEAKKEAEIAEARESARVKIREKAPVKFENKAHQEDDERAVEAVYRRIREMGAGPMPITEFYTSSAEENINVFVSVLHLVRNGLLDVYQTELPYGEITVQIRVPETSVPVEAAAVN